MLLRNVLSLENRNVVTVIGAGGKTSTLMQIFHELNQEKQKVILTTTTKMLFKEVSNFNLIIGNSTEEILNKISKEKDTKLLVIGTGTTTDRFGNQKLVGISKEILEDIKRKCPEYKFLIEGDGANRKPFKAHGHSEPVIPVSTDLVIAVIGIDALGKPIEEKYIHRAEILSNLADVPEKTPLTEEIIAKIIMDKRSFLKEVKDNMDYIIIINKVDDDEKKEKAESLAKEILKRGCKKVLLTCMYSDNKILEVLE